MKTIRNLSGLLVASALVVSAFADEPVAANGEGRRTRRETRTAEQGRRSVDRGRMPRMSPRKAITGPQCLVLVIDTSAAAPKMFSRTVRIATEAVQRLKETDTVSIVTFDEVAETVLPATSAKEREKILDVIKSLKPKGEKALMAGLARGAEEVRKAAEGQAKRMLLLSSPTPTTIGPGAPEDLRKFSDSLRKEGIRFNGGMRMMGPFGDRPDRRGPGFRSGREGRDGEPGMRSGRRDRSGGRRGVREGGGSVEGEKPVRPSADSE